MESRGHLVFILSVDYELQKGTSNKIPGICKAA